MKKLRERATESQLGPRSFSRLCDQGRPPSQVSRTKTQGSKVFASRVSGPDLSTVGRPPDQARGGFLEAGLGLGELALHLVLDRLRLFRVNLGLFLVRCVKVAQLRYFQGNSMVGMVLMYVTTLGWLVDVLLAQVKYHILRCANAFMGAACRRHASFHCYGLFRDFGRTSSIIRRCPLSRSRKRRASLGRSLTSTFRARARLNSEIASLSVSFETQQGLPIVGQRRAPIREVWAQCCSVYAVPYGGLPYTE